MIQVIFFLKLWVWSSLIYFKYFYGCPLKNVSHLIYSTNSSEETCQILENPPETGKDYTVACLKSSVVFV